LKLNVLDSNVGGLETSVQTGVTLYGGFTAAAATDPEIMWLDREGSGKAATIPIHFAKRISENFADQKVFCYFPDWKFPTPIVPLMSPKRLQSNDNNIGFHDI
jgi:hypothetical protein